MIAIVGTQYWDPETFRDAYPRAYKLHKLINQPDNVKRFIIGRQFCTVLTGFLLAQIFTFAQFPNPGYNPVGFFIIVRSGLVGVMIVLAFGQLMPELLAAEFPLRFMNMYGAYSVGYLSLFFDAVGVGHAAWTFYYCSRPFICRKLIADAAANGEIDLESRKAELKPKIIHFESAEILSVTPKKPTTSAAKL
jgi:Silicon transporter/Cyclin M transmembrane N-terminal domain